MTSGDQGTPTLAFVGFLQPVAVSLAGKSVAPRLATPVSVGYYGLYGLHGLHGLILDGWRQVEVDDGVAGRTDAILVRVGGVRQLKGEEEHEDGGNGVHS